MRSRRAPCVRSSRAGVRRSAEWSVAPRAASSSNNTLMSAPTSSRNSHCAKSSDRRTRTSRSAETEIVGAQPGERGGQQAGAEAAPPGADHDRDEENDEERPVGYPGGDCQAQGQRRARQHGSRGMGYPSGCPAICPAGVRFHYGRVFSWCNTGKHSGWECFRQRNGWPEVSSYLRMAMREASALRRSISLGGLLSTSSTPGGTSPSATSRGPSR